MLKLEFSPLKAPVWPGFLYFHLQFCPCGADVAKPPARATCWLLESREGKEELWPLQGWEHSGVITARPPVTAVTSPVTSLLHSLSARGSCVYLKPPG